MNESEFGVIDGAVYEIITHVVRDLEGETVQVEEMRLEEVFEHPDEEGRDEDKPKSIFLVLVPAYTQDGRPTGQAMKVPVKEATSAREAVDNVEAAIEELQKKMRQPKVQIATSAPAPPLQRGKSGGGIIIP